MKIDRNLKWLFAITLISALSIGWFSLEVQSDITTLNLASSRSVVSRRETNNKAFLVIDFGNGDTRTSPEKITSNTTAFDLLEKGTESLGLRLETKQYDFGILVDKIGLLKNGQNDSYWIYYVNGQAPDVASDKKILTPGDNVKFKFEESIY
jgi:hypothetical protein